MKRSATFQDQTEVESVCLNRLNSQAVFPSKAASRDIVTIAVPSKHVEIANRCPVTLNVIVCDINIGNSGRITDAAFYTAYIQNWGSRRFGTWIAEKCQQ